MSPPRSAIPGSPGGLPGRAAASGTIARIPTHRHNLAVAAAAGIALAWAVSAHAVILWSDLGETAVKETGAGVDILGGAVKRDMTASDVLYFKFHVNPISDASTEKYFAAFQLYEGDSERLAVGNSLEAWAYSAFNTMDKGASNQIPGDVDLYSSRPQFRDPLLGAFFSYELPRRGIESTIVFKVQYAPGGEDLVTVWLNPDLAPGATEVGQPESLTTRFKADASFNEIHLRHGGGGGGWIFSDMAIATAFDDFVAASGAGPVGAASRAGAGSSRVTVQTWRREQGLPQDSVRALAQTRDGYLWVGSDDGVARFDGVRFVPFGQLEGLWSGPVNVLFEDSRGALWMGTAGGGLTRMQAGRLTTFTTKDGLPAEAISALAEDNEGRLWVGTEGGLVTWQGGRLSPLSAAEEFKGKPITALFKDRRGVIWLGATKAGVFQFRDGKFIKLTDLSMEGSLQDPHCLLVDRSGRIWVGTGDDFVLCRDGEEWHPYRIPRHLARPYVSALAEQPDGTVWAGSVSEGLYQFQQGKPTVVNASSGLSDNFVESLLVDREGNLWVGTAAGLNRLRRSRLSVFSQSEGLGYGAVQGMVEVAPDVIWAGKPSDGLYRWEGRNFAPLPAAGLARPHLWINSLMMAADGSCWVASAQGLVHFKDPKVAAPEAEPGELEGLNVIALAKDRKGGLWAGTREGTVWLRRNGQWEEQTRYANPHPITAIAQDLDDAMWIGTEGDGLYRFKGAESAHLDKAAGLLSAWVRTLYLDPQGVLWIGTAGGGLGRWRAGRLTSFTTREGLPDNTISQILDDDQGRLWLASNRGIACVSKRELEELADGKIPLVNPQLYGRAEGMLSEECTGGYFPAGLKTKSGLLWFSTLKGIVVADPSPRTTEVLAPAVVLEEVLVDGVSRLDFRSSGSTANERDEKAGTGDADALRIPPGRHRIELRFTGVSFDAPERLRFRYRLEGLDPRWVEAKTARTAVYSYVPPGRYHFHVIACNSRGVWNETGATLALTVARHFWQAWWFIGLAALGLLAAVAGAARLVEKQKVQRRLKYLEQEQALARERARIARDLHDDLGSSLARISLLSELLRADGNQPGQLKAHVDKIAESADETVRALEEIVWAVRPGSDSLQSLVEYIAHFASELFADGNVRCRLDLPPDLPQRPLPPEMRHNIFLIVKEALTNVLKHASAKEVYVQAKVAADSLEILVQDDGKGFDPQSLPSQSRRFGLGNMPRRAEAIGGTLTVQSAPGKGTAVRLAVPLPVTAAG